MTHNKWLLHDGRALEIRDRRVMTSYEIWIYENDRPLCRHSTVSLRETVQRLAAGEDLLARAIEAAAFDIQSGRLLSAPAA